MSAFTWWRYRIQDTIILVASYVYVYYSHKGIIDTVIGWVW